MQSLKGAEQFLTISQVEAGAVVANKICRVTVADRSRKLDARRIARSGELPGIAEQILEHHLEQPSIALGHETVGNRGLDASVGPRPLQLGIDVAGQRAQVDPFVPEIAARDTSQRQQRVDQLRHGLCRLPDVGEMLLPGVVKRFVVVFQQYLTEAVDAAQRSTQVMRYRIAERVE